VEIHHEVESRPPEAHREPGIFADSPPTPALLDHDQLVDVRVVRHDGRGFALDEVPEMRLGERPLQCADERGREHYVSD